jgi:hypothetical protein
LRARRSRGRRTPRLLTARRPFAPLLVQGLLAALRESAGLLLVALLLLRGEGLPASASVWRSDIRGDAQRFNQVDFVLLKIDR